MSGFQVLLNLVPFPQHPEIAVIVLTRLNLTALRRLSLSNGAQDCLFKQHATGEELDQIIRKAIAAVGPTRKIVSSEHHRPHREALATEKACVGISTIQNAGSRHRPPKRI